MDSLKVRELAHNITNCLAQSQVCAEVQKYVLMDIYNSVSLVAEKEVQEALLEREEINDTDIRNRDTKEE